MSRKSSSLTLRVRAVGSKLLKGKYLERCKYALHRRAILSQEAGHRALSEAIRKREPVAAGKIGDVEMEGLVKLYHQPGGGTDDRRWRGDRERLYVNAGVYPPTPEAFRAFGPAYLEGLREITHMGVWHNWGEERLTREHCPRAALMPIRSLEPYYDREPWSRHLAGLKVLIATSFPKSIAHQLKRRKEIWRDDRGVLPEFEAAYIPVPPHAYLLKTPVYADWQTGLRVMKEKVAAANFDVLLVGAGAWSIPLAGYAKSLGKIGVHLGGGLQVLFGIKGHRWATHELSGYWNDAWIHPLPEETPDNVQAMERSAYW
jgi:hypothetical protein